MEKGYLSRWVLPELGLNDGTIYAGRPVGKSLKLIYYINFNRQFAGIYVLGYVVE